MESADIIGQIVSFAPAVAVLMWVVVAALRANTRLIGLLIEIVRVCDCSGDRDMSEVVRKAGEM